MKQDQIQTTGIRSVSLRRSSQIHPETLDHARDISLSLLRSFVDRPSYILGVTSALPGEGKTSIATALAEVMSSDFGLDVILVDSHAERPGLSVEEEQGTSCGLSDWLAGDCSLEDALIPLHDRCTTLPIGSQPISSRDLLQYLVNADALRQLRERYSLIVMDLPDLVNPAAAALANLSDGIVLVVKSGETPIDRVREFLPLLQNVTIHGVVLNLHRPKVPAFIRRAFA